MPACLDFSDVESEVLPISSYRISCITGSHAPPQANGHRMTLTYSLYGTWKVSPSVEVSALRQDISINPFYTELRATLGNPVFMRDGGVLVFASHHKYAHTDLNTAELLHVHPTGADKLCFLLPPSLVCLIVKPIVKAGQTYTKYILALKFTHLGWEIEMNGTQRESTRLSVLNTGLRVH